MGYDEVHYQNENDEAEETDRMVNEGGGVVAQNNPPGALIQRSSLTEVKGQPGEEAQTGGLSQKGNPE